MKQGNMEKYIRGTSVSALFSNMKARYNNEPIPFRGDTLVRADVSDIARFDMGGHDPATPFMEATINYHNHAVTFMIFVVLTCTFLIRP